MLLLICSMLLGRSKTMIAQEVSSFNNSNSLSEQQQISNACKQLDQALLDADTAVLKTILHQQLSLDHSNGLIENREDLLQHVSSGFLKYKEIVDDGFTEVRLVKDIATVRRNIKVSGSLNGVDFDVTLKVLEVWLYLDKEWNLLSAKCETTIND